MLPILVIGDSTFDIFFYGTCDRLAPDAPVPVFDIKKEVKTLGMAGNVYRNIIALDFPCKLKTNSNFEAITKTRFVDIKTNHMFIRVDSRAHYPHITDLNKINFKDFIAIVISDYNKGFLTESDIEYITLNHPLTFLDTKKVLGPWANNSTFIKINRKEYKTSFPFITSHLQSKIIETIGEEGCKYQDKIFPVELVEVKNLSGAGDSFLAGLVVNFVQTNDMNEAIPFANSIATKIVQKLGIGTVKG